MKVKRLPPQPTDTSLARLVRRLIDCIPAVSIGRHRRLQDERDKAYRHIIALRAQCDALENSLGHLLDDLERRMVDPWPAAHIKTCMRRSDAEMEVIHRVSVTFDPIEYRFAINDMMVSSQRGEVSAYTASAMRKIAQKIGQRHALDIERRVIEATSQRYGVDVTGHG